MAKTQAVPAAEFTRNFGRYRMLAQKDAVPVTSLFRPDRSRTQVCRRSSRPPGGRLSGQDAALADALKAASGYIEQSGDAHAARLFDEFNRKIAAGEDKTLLSALWDGIVKLLPGIVSIGEAAAKIGAFLA